MTSSLATDAGDAAAGAGGSSNAAGASGSAGSGPSAGANGADAGGRGGSSNAGAGGELGRGGTGGRGNLGTCNGLPQSDDRYAYVPVCPAGATLISEGGGTLTDSMNRTLYPCAACSDMLCVLCRDDVDGGMRSQSVWCVGPAAQMATYGTCR